MCKIITIKRKLLFATIKTHYFQTENCPKDSAAHLLGYSHSFTANETLKSFETLHINLLKSEDELMLEMHKSTRRQVRKAAEEGFQHIVVEKPKKKDLREFQRFYNEFAKNKRTYKCNAYHMKTMMLLSEKDSLMMTYIKDHKDRIYCYRVYITDGLVAMNLYSASHFRMVENTEEKRLLGYANRYLIWKSILWFKEKGHVTYDMGGLTSNENIRKFKMGFGGEIITVYSGYVAQTNFGKLFLTIRNLNLGFRKVGDAS